MGRIKELQMQVSAINSRMEKLEKALSKISHVKGFVKDGASVEQTMLPICGDCGRCTEFKDPWDCVENIINIALYGQPMGESEQEINVAYDKMCEEMCNDTK